MNELRCISPEEAGLRKTYETTGGLTATIRRIYVNDDIKYPIRGSLDYPPLEGKEISWTRKGRYTACWEQHEFNLKMPVSEALFLEGYLDGRRGVVPKEQDDWLEEANEITAEDVDAALDQYFKMPKAPDARYTALTCVLNEALAQARDGKGNERHATGEAFEEQEICQTTRAVGLGFPFGQARKKIREAKRLYDRGMRDAAIHECYGAINYIAAGIIVIKEDKG